MRKLIDIPQDSVKDLKILAIKDDESFKSYIEKIIIAHLDGHNRFTELTRTIINDGQDIRAIINYLADTYENIIECEDIEVVEKLKDKKHYYSLIIDACNHMIIHSS